MILSEYQVNLHVKYTLSLLKFCKMSNPKSIQKLTKIFVESEKQVKCVHNEYNLVKPFSSLSFYHAGKETDRKKPAANNFLKRK